MLEKPKIQKMKLAGYSCLFFAAVLTVCFFAGAGDEGRIAFMNGLIGTWVAAGITLLTVNAGKRIGGEIANAKIQGNEV